MRLRWQIGDVRVTRVQEFEAPGIGFILPDATRENLRAIDWIGPWVTSRGDAVGSVHSLVLEIGDRRILVDACVGNDKPRLPLKLWHERHGPFLADLASAGFPVETIDTVVCTHLHTDHVGWNTRLVDGRWVPTFAKARTLVTRPEWEHWSRASVEDMRATLEDSVQPLFDAGLVDLVAMDHEVAPGIQLVPTPGHSPGHISIRIASGGDTAVITGDVAHHPAQLAAPHWKCLADHDSAMAERTRRTFLERLADTSTLIIGTHFAGPTAGRVVRQGDAYRLEGVTRS
jgi:glyoxylase-like metal-dependent hydrolase (beta-lactamase superfamily II)